MSKELVEYLESERLIIGEKANVYKIARMSINKMLQHVENILEITLTSIPTRNNSPYTYTASLSLGGGRFPCFHVECRIQKVRQLSQFAALYGDKVYIKNFFADYFRHHGFSKKAQASFIEANFLFDLEVLATLVPLLQNETIVLFTPPSLCTSCLTGAVLGSRGDRILEKERTRLMRKFLQEIKAVLTFENGKYAIELEGPQNLLEHGTQVFTYSRILPLSPLLLKKAKAQKAIPLSLAAKLKSGCIDALTQNNFENILFDLSTSQILGTSFLTERTLHTEIMNRMTGNIRIANQNQIALEYLSSLVPFISDISTKELLRLRTREEDSFVLFRHALNKAIIEYKAAGLGFTKRDAQSLYADVIEPKLAKLNSRVRAAQKDLIKKTIAKPLAIGATISFGIYTGLLPNGLAAAAAALGLINVMPNFLDSIMGKADTHKEIATDEMYFLWKVKQISKR